MTVTVPVGCRVWVLLEGASDVAALRVVAQRSGIGLADEGIHLVDMRGVTNIRRHLLAATEAPDSPQVLGMCDAPEARFVVRALRRVGCAVAAVDELPWWGFQVCDRDLEDELMRDLGENGIRTVLEDLGLTQRFAMLTQQPAWVSESFHEQVHRFAGAASGRKELMAAAMAGALDVAALPRPLAGLVEALSAPGPTFDQLRGAPPDEFGDRLADRRGD
ncbi:hypothetical protein BJ986_000762 [Phycicoccus badiiscoriae]|uniref:OLD protein-like TOPRIM domain-containing protein n=1 Tax=Pedococcus badiiscoriae TaxID=642776 RepID=A0A852WJ28_9MICO|nr:TOPRIM nucleotidyl transferase/hydrolase domain-containing protein [Pedococcus badiiscoriae]NYG06275.1 hypothetical protein [Pedococcus badiiscoriae]